MTKQTQWVQPLVVRLNQHALRAHQVTKKGNPQWFKFLSSLKAMHKGYFTVNWFIGVIFGLGYGFFLLHTLITVWGFIAGIVIFVATVISVFAFYLLV